MFFRQVLHEDLGCASYLVADGGEAAVIDPKWDVEDYLALAQRVQADFENYRKRVTMQAGEEAQRATARLVEELLPVLDACEAAFTHGAEQVEPIWSALIGALQKQGLEAMDIQGKPFDPAVLVRTVRSILPAEAVCETEP